MHIGALIGKDAKNNRLVIETLALNKPLIKWDVYKLIKQENKISWSTVSRRIDDLKDRGYLIETGTRKINFGKGIQDSPTYGLTWKGLLASIHINKIKQNILQVYNVNQHLKIPIQFWIGLEETYTDEAINEMASIVADAIQRSPVELESIKSVQEIIIHLIPYLDYDKLASFGISELPEKVFNVILTRARKNLILGYEKTLVDNLKMVRLAKKQLGIDSGSEE